MTLLPRRRATKPKHKGQRLCFVAGILDGGTDGSKLLTTRVFRGGHRQTKDYHGMFTGALIVMDNASYHKVVPSDTPKGTWKKQDPLAACERFGVAESANEYRSVMVEVVSMAPARGYEVVYKPPYHSDLQPIEYVWAYLKGNVGRQYTTDTTMEDVRARLALSSAS
ncbi:hypothetical protein H257_15122 [Aphanomyces astaci]|uniref:Tc1-like transposase DDE domain-containing protein n=1 Tax=Aphanomyces astaci TaxID=112090 RepID=W4FNV7_APHAT|nr:hypothetical protein H257_15122 [Aphanomyces astaci]ETV69167.1 hypothetical protein H257_15122 [Aphanomyces astaci]|eukprot:XP_009841420.1 hypothetical protein H257_15122 [Aphanomyces astaci]